MIKTRYFKEKPAISSLVKICILENPNWSNVQIKEYVEMYIQRKVSMESIKKNKSLARKQINELINNPNGEFNKTMKKLLSKEDVQQSLMGSIISVSDCVKRRADSDRINISELAETYQNVLNLTMGR